MQKSKTFPGTKFNARTIRRAVEQTRSLSTFVKGYIARHPEYVDMVASA
jgi:hypothetical protein